MFRFEPSTSKRPNPHLRFGRNLDVDFCCYYWLLPTLRPNVQTSNKKKKIFKTFLFSLPPQGLVWFIYKKEYFFMDSWTFGRSSKKTLKNKEILRPRSFFKLGRGWAQLGRKGQKQ